jgi:acyl-CoA ligase (AMP-forming) (exosortase A-associated)
MKRNDPMLSTTLLHDLPLASAQRSPARPALVHGDQSLSYGELADAITRCAHGFAALGIGRGERIGIYLEKRAEAVIAAFGAAAAGCVLVPVNPLLRPAQVAYILRDCSVRALVTSAPRHARLRAALGGCAELRHVVLAGDAGESGDGGDIALHAWSAISGASACAVHRVVDSDMAAILYTSGSTGRPKGVVLSHRNLVAGAKSVAGYLGNCPDDRLLAVLPLSFDAGFSQLTTAFHSGACAVLLNYLVPNDVVKAIASERITGLTAVPPLYIQLTQLAWPESAAAHLRYFANTGGRMPRATLEKLRSLFPHSRPYLMYGLTEAFRATYLPPEEVDRRPDSIGKAIPDAEVLVLRADGTPCAPGEDGELVQRGALVAMGYWNDAEKTAERFRALPSSLRPAEHGLMLPEIAVYSGDTVRSDEDGYLYFVGRRDEMIKTSGYRVSPSEIEEVVYATQLVAEAAAFGIPHASLGEAIAVVVTPALGSTLDAGRLLAACREHLPLYMLPAKIEIRTDPLPRNANGKIDRALLRADFSSGDVVTGASAS